MRKKIGMIAKLFLATSNFKVYLFNCKFSYLKWLKTINVLDSHHIEKEFSIHKIFVKLIFLLNDKVVHLVIC
jgi:hypothetical protein